MGARVSDNVGDEDRESAAERVISGRYRLLEPLGRGGMGVVWRARDEVLARDVAVKEVRAPAGLDAAGLQRMYRRLEREAWAAARISHRGVVTVYDVASEDGRPWIVMELVRGLSLAEVLDAEGPMSPQAAAHLGEQVLAALRSAHDSGVLHRDVKPGNVLLANDGRVVLGDFGIASLEGSSAITMTGEMVGSPEFLAPERALGREPSPGSDLWSLGVTLYVAVEGISPFRRATPLDTLEAVVEAEPPATRRAGVLAPVLEGLLRKDPAERLAPAEAARMLRLVGAGGTVRAAGGPVSGPGPEGTTSAAHPRQEPPDGGTAGGGAPGAESGPPRTAGPYGEAAQAPRQGRAGLVLTAGIVVLLLALAALGWLLFGGRGDPGGSGGAPAGTEPGPGAAGSAGAGSFAASSRPAPVSPSDTGQAYPGVYVDAVRAAYRGGCPPPAERAPAFTATVEVDRTPAVLEYRWATRSGRTSGPGWQSLAYEAGGPVSRRLEHAELTHEPGAALTDAVRLEVRGPAEVTSAWVETSVTCEEATPTGGPASPGTSTSPTPDPGPDTTPDPTPTPSPAPTSVPAPASSAPGTTADATPGPVPVRRAGQAAFVKTGR
ncbi:serine/threonine-protein kinase [Streptomyces sp. NPDC058613]|uniref:serine/threonine-protein kinase n=1 Tax=Streptomyces sp. NPDC058613 TaxID=3346556 RepID=UPI00365FF4D4